MIVAEGGGVAVSYSVPAAVMMFGCSAGCMHLDRMVVGGGFACLGVCVFLSQNQKIIVHNMMMWLKPQNPPLKIPRKSKQGDDTK